MNLDPRLAWSAPLAEQRARCEAETLEEVCSALRDLDEAETTAMVATMGRAEKGTYGYCIDCQRDIDTDRLRTPRPAERCAACELARQRHAARGGT
jgi:RNA polymerase-binding transcription factor DksA